MAEFVGAIDQGTTSTRFMIFDHSGNVKGVHQLEHEQILPQAGWVEHNPVEIWERTSSVVQTALNEVGLTVSDLAALGITNQRETTVIWDKNTGRPLYNAIVWQDTRTDRIASALDRDGRGDVIRQKAGLPPATYFSGGKIQWILENVDGVRDAAERGEVGRGQPGLVDGGLHDRAAALPDLDRVVLDPAGLRHDLVVLELVLAALVARVVEDHEPRAGRALVDGSDEVGHGDSFG
jgi:glycerol kinase